MNDTDTNYRIISEYQEKNNNNNDIQRTDRKESTTFIQVEIENRTVT